MLKIFNSLSGNTEEFNPINYPKVNMYVCGATAYNDIHIGNARPIVFFDVVKNYLNHKGYECFYVSNITDVDDRIINKAIEQNVTEKEIASKYIKNLQDITKKLVGKLPDETPKATEYISEMIKYINNLIETGYAYVNETGVYFRVSKISDYGILSKQELQFLDSGVRVDLKEDKENTKDFALWKFTDKGIVYESSFGNGRPGWHTECAVMNKVIFNGEIDIHGGGVDLKFPHHENEIAQTMASDHHHLAKYWMHVGHLNMQNVKMSKSLGNVVYLKDAINEYPSGSFILLLLSSNYRQPINYSDDLMVQFSKEYDKISRAVKKTFFSLRDYYQDKQITGGIYLKRFDEAMDDDFNTSNAITVIYDLIKDINKTKNIDDLNDLYQQLSTILNILDLMPHLEIEESDIENYSLWQKAREEKDFEKADIYREKLALKGWI